MTGSSGVSNGHQTVMSEQNSWDFIPLPYLVIIFGLRNSVTSETKVDTEKAESRGLSAECAASPFLKGCIWAASIYRT